MFLLNLGLAFVSIYTGYFSYHSIINAQHYESRTEKAAKHSSTADDQLWQSRKTLGSGALACILSVISSLYALLSSGPASARSLLLSVLNIALCLGSRQLISDFWGQKTTLPGMKHLNEAIEFTDKLRVWLVVTAGLWGLTCVVMAFGG